MISERTFARSFESFWRELLPFLTPHFISLFNEAYGQELECPQWSSIAPPSTLPISSHADIVAELAYQLARRAHLSKMGLDEILAKGALASAEADALALIEKYQRRKVAVSLEPGEQEEAIVLCERYQALYSAFPPGTAVEFTPQIRGAGFVDSCEGDIAISNCLVEVKTTNRKPSSKDLRQVFIYIALDLNAGNDRWTEFAIFNPRRCTLHRAAIEPLTFRLSGGRPLIDVVSDLISFVESNEIIANDQF